MQIFEVNVSHAERTVSAKALKAGVCPMDRGHCACSSTREIMVGLGAES